MTQETENENTNVFVRRGTRAALGWLTTGMITVNVILMWYMLQKIVDLNTRVSVIEDSRFTTKDAEKLRRNIEDVRSGYIEAVTVIGGKIDLVQYRLTDLNKTMDELKSDLKERHERRD